MTVNWPEYRLKHLARVIVDKAASSSGQGPYVGLGAITSWTGKIDLRLNEDSDESVGNRFRPGDVLFGKLRPYLAKVCAPNFFGYCSGEALVLRPYSRLIPSFLFYRMVEAGVIDKVNASTYGAKMPRASWNFIGNLRLQIPSCHTQISIASFLDRETERIDALIEKKERLVELINEKRSAIITAAITGQIDLEMHQRRNFGRYGGVTGRIFESFPQTHNLPVRAIRLGLMARIFSGGTPHRDKQEFWENGEFPWIGSGEVNQGLITVPTAYITRSAVQQSATKLFPSGSVAMALAGQGKTKATVATMGINAYGNQSLACITEFKGESKFLFWWLTSLYKEIRGLCSQDTRDGLNQSMIGQIPVPDYPYVTQKSIVNFLDRETKKFDALRQKTFISINRLRKLRAALITDAVTGQIDVATWNRHGQCEKRNYR